jgi:glutamine cyclotransferase
MKKLITTCSYAAGLFMKRKSDMKKIVIIVFFTFAATSYGSQGFGPYTITRTIQLYNPAGLDFIDNYLYSMEDYMGNIHKIDPATGNIVADFWVPGRSLHDDMPYDYPSGLAYDGTNFWMTTYGPSNLRKLTLGSPPSVTVNAMYSLPDWTADLIYVNGFLYVPVMYESYIYKINPSTGAVVGTIPSPSQTIYGLTFDGQNLIAAYGPGGIGSGRIWVISPSDGTIIDEWETGLDVVTRGLAYDRCTDTLYIGTNEGIMVAQTPEPATLFLLGLGGLALLRKRRA